MNFDLQTALKYTTDTVQALLTELQKPEHNEHRWGTDQSKTLRGMLADALRDAAEGHTDAAQIQDLNKQADLLQNPEQHIVVANGKVRAGKFTDKPITKAAGKLLDHLHRWSEGQYGEPDAIKWRDVSGFLREHPEEEGEGSHPYGTLQVDHGQYEDDLTREHIHYHQLPDRVHAAIMDSVNGADWGWNTDSTVTNQSEEEWQKNSDETDRLEKELQEAPYEEVDAKHPSERPQQ